MPKSRDSGSGAGDMALSKSGCLPPTRSGDPSLLWSPYDRRKPTT